MEIKALFGFLLSSVNANNYKYYKGLRFTIKYYVTVVHIKRSGSKTC